MTRYEPDFGAGGEPYTLRGVRTVRRGVFGNLPPARGQGAKFLLYFEDAKKAVEELEITLTSRDGGSERIPMCGVPYHSAHTYVERLIDKGYKVAICEQVENPAAAKGVVKREVVRVITPGTIIEDDMLVDQENNFLLTLTGTEDHVALAAVDLSTGECYITELTGSLELIMGEISSYQPKEIVLDETLATISVLKERLEIRLKCLITPYSIDAKSERELEEELPDQFPQYKEACNTPYLQRVVCLLFSYLKQTQKRALHHIQRLNRYDARQYMILDETARKNLELWSTLGEGKKRGSLLWLLDQTATAMGSRMLKKWLDKPLLTINEIRRRQNMVQAFLDDFLMLDEVRDMMKQVYDLERLAARISYGSANGRDLNSVSRSLSIIPRLKKRLAETNCKPLRQLAEEMDECGDLQSLIAEAITDEPPISVKEGGIIREGYNPELDKLRSIQKDGKSWIAELEQKEREQTGIKSLKIRYNRVFGYYIEVTKSNLHLVPEQRYHRKQTLANSERFITPELKEREQLILNASEKSVELEYELFTRVREKIAGQVHRLQALSERVAELDVLHAFALVAKRYHYVRPEVHNGNHLRIKAGRHPVVEAVTGTGEFVANDVELDSENSQVLLITGPNMAGKSTYMRQIALITILGQIGSFVPADEAEIAIVDRIFTRIGAADDLIGGRSTFMVEMAETRHALKEATGRSLILLDEVGRGTSTHDGMALAQAIVEYIHDHIGAKTLFSTHYHELTELEKRLPRLVNVHAQCIERNGKVVFLHRIVPGGTDRSYGIHVAELAGIPAKVIERAKQLLSELDQARSQDKSNSSSALSGQLSLFGDLPVDEAAPDSGQAVSETIPAVEKEVLDALRKWDLMNKTPFECMQFLFETKQKLDKD
ncbi:DNA mismatch repair protein MutS [Thermoactinomyces mirandus]|uniref:DNA mismatch repair protein MutS n=1 Tax=Thermoactinomyces mirandus TaxID=2756294 RepID=A0A7W1XS86_9BACL|nr:DNA mismatch repair protein MutS [Thermoactinomyces mirandus]MBA4602354.1 DNA mismatch repair protein MutS [Thermoactinomyces mirandus]